MEQLTLQARPQRNHYLFSDYYLEHRAPQRPEWRMADARPLLQRLGELWRAFSPQQPNEAQTEERWIRPVLAALGHHYNVQVSLRTPLGARTPDYVFFPSEAARAAAPTGTLEERDLQGALAVGDAKAWNLDLDQPLRAPRDGVQVKTSDNPSYQIDFYIRHSGLPWGVLSNGRHWRLYHKDSSKELDVYYEVDLPALLERGDPEAFKYFYLFFRSEAFQGERPWLDLMLAESQAYEQGVSEGLKGQVYDALRALAQGFLDYRGNALRPTPEALQEIHDNSLIVLYRLLFTLYAESRGLLPLGENEAYTRHYSLDALKHRLAHDIDSRLPALPSMNSDWIDLHQLWSVLNEGHPELGVPAYNGGLFSPANYPFLERYCVGDAHLRQAIDLLARTPDPQTGEREFVDYRDLEIRHLGSIYEGLLEYRLLYAEGPLTVRREKGREIYTPIPESPSPPAPLPPRAWERGEETLPPDRGAPGPLPVNRSAPGPLPADVSAGQVYLATDKGERKATGSYYTPDYIVQYIVEHTVGPLLEEQRARHADAGGHITDEAALVRDILALNVLDPAMGSGHFLVAATDYIARYLVELALTPPEGLGTEDEVSFWRRRVAQRCIYGVDLNPLAVELAKLSLWLATVARDKPLSFLDHHLRCGNSLIGARVADLPLQGNGIQEKRARYAVQRVQAQRRAEEAARAAGQRSMLDDAAFAGTMRTAARTMGDIELLRSDTLAQVHEAERLYRDVVEQVTRGHRTLADVWTARHFGLSFDEALWPGLTQYVLRGASAIQLPQYQAILDQAQAIARERCFFHWELEFPEVFFDDSGRLLEDRAGFDAVIGNPPWGGLRTLGKLGLALKAGYRTAGIAPNWFAFFLELALSLSSRGAMVGQIIPGGWQTANESKDLRELLMEQLAIETFINLPYDVFSDAYTEAVIVIGRRAQSGVLAWTNAHPAMLTYERREKVHLISDSDPRWSTVAMSDWIELDPDNLSFFTFLPRATLELAKKVSTQSIQLRAIADVQRGITPYFLVDTKQAGNLAPALDGQLLRYTYDFSGTCWVRYDPAIAEYKDPKYFTGRRLIVRQLISRQFRIQAVLATEDFVVNQSHQIVLLTDTNWNLACALALVNCRLNSYLRVQGSALALRDDFPKLVLDDTRSVPLYDVAFTTPPADRARYVAEAIAAYAAAVPDADLSPVLALVEEHLVAQPERSDVVHDLLAHLAEQMMALHQSRQAEMAGFLSWLERELGAPLDTLSNKTALRNYLGDYQKGEAHLPFESWLAILRKSQRKVFIDLARRWVQERLQQEYEESLGKLLPLKARLAGTDRLIDLIVYRLYGLTEEEVAIVESSGHGGKP